MTDNFEISGKTAILKRYRKKSTALHYIKNRFSEPVWQMAHEKQVQFINTALAKHKPKKILDLACGPARVSADLKQEYFSSGIASDANDAMLEVAEKRLGGKWKTQKADAFNLPFEKSHFDCITSFRFIRHFGKENRKKLYEQISHVLKSKGLMIIDALNATMLRGPYIEKFTGYFDKSIYDQPYTLDEIKSEMDTAGFHLIKKQNILNNWKTLLHEQGKLQQKNYDEGKIVAALSDLDADDTSKNFMWITLWQKK